MTPIAVVEVGPRDGLQNEHAPVATADKIAFVNALSAAGATRIEVTAFVSPKWVPQMADAADVLAGIDRRPGVAYSALVPNLQGVERAAAAAVADIAIFAAASETFSRRNINASIDASRDLVLIFGSETRGLPADLLERHADRVVALPIASPRVRSLNLSTTVGIAIYEVLRRRHARAPDGSPS